MRGPEKGGREGWVHGQEKNGPGSIKRTKMSSENFPMKGCPSNFKNCGV